MKTFQFHLTRIGKQAFECCYYFSTIEIPENSELQASESEAFCITDIEYHITKISDSNIEEIYFPKSLIELEEGW